MIARAIYNKKLNAENSYYFNLVDDGETYLWVLNRESFYRFKVVLDKTENTLTIKMKRYNFYLTKEGIDVYGTQTKDTVVETSNPNTVINLVNDIKYYYIGGTGEETNSAVRIGAFNGDLRQLFNVFLIYDSYGESLTLYYNGVKTVLE